MCHRSERCNVSGVTTYVSILKDSNGNRQGYGMVTYNNRIIFATGNAPQSARRAFLNKLLSNVNGNDLVQAGGEQLTINVVIERIAVMSDSILFLVNDENSQTIFSVPKETNFEAPPSAPGDKVKLKFSPVNTSPQPVTFFDNIDIGERLCD